MKFSEIWLREWINPAISSETLLDQITMAGLEVDRVEPVSGAFHGVIIGEVIECAKHPHSHKLHVTKVNIGGDRLLDIICGAQNCRTGLKVAVATVGAILPNNVKIKAIKLCGKPSEGMLCSFAELGILNSHEGLIEIPYNAPIGTDICDYLQLNDNTIEISVTPNRADCLSIIGIARDLGVLNKMAINEPYINPVLSTMNTTIPIQVSVPHGCPRYLGRVLKGINVKVSSPLWMREKLRRSGIRSINAIIDISNYVLLELGQPIHAFDLNKIDGGIVIRMAEEEETLVLIDGKELKLNTDTLVIADTKKALAIAGIVGGKLSEVNNETQDILLESAFFNPLSITGRARRYGLHTDASHRYERGVDHTIQYQAMDRVTFLVIEICGGHVGPVIDVTNKNALPTCAKIHLHRNNLDRLLGYVISSQQVSDILCRLGCKVIKQGDIWFVVAPTWRFDITIEEDLIEEVARIYGYDNIPAVPVRANLVMIKHPESHLTLKRVKTLLVDQGFQEAITYSFVNPKVQSLLHPGKEALILLNPISVEMSVMRLSLLTGLLSTVVYNQNRQQNNLCLFESGICFIPDNIENFSIYQHVMLAGVMTGNMYEEHWDVGHKIVDFYDLKGTIESILELTGKLSDIKFKVTDNPALHPGQSAAIYLHEECIGYIGMIHPDIEHKLNLSNHTLAFELQWDKIAKCKVPLAKEVSRFPGNRRDIAIVVPEKVAAEDLLTECKKIGINQIVSVKLFDVYRGHGIEDGYKSLAISLMLQDNNHTLAEEEITAIVTKCVAVLRQRFQAYLRD